jgi:hypothetical protein
MNNIFPPFFSFVLTPQAGAEKGLDTDGVSHSSLHSIFFLLKEKVSKSSANPGLKEKTRVTTNRIKGLSRQLESIYDGCSHRSCSLHFFLLNLVPVTSAYP